MTEELISARQSVLDGIAAYARLRGTERAEAMRRLSARPWIARPFYGCWRAMCIPLADRLNRNPPVCECSLITTPFSFLR
jgi:hypothetical protein